MKYLAARFIALYIILGAIGVGAVAGAVALALLPGVKHQVSAVRAQLGSSDLEAQACVFVSQQAQGAGLVMLTCRALSEKQSGNAATVLVSAKLTDGTVDHTLKLDVSFRRGVWSPVRVVAG